MSDECDLLRLVEASSACKAFSNKKDIRWTESGFALAGYTGCACSSVISFEDVFDAIISSSVASGRESICRATCTVRYVGLLSARKNSVTRSRKSKGDLIQTTLDALRRTGGAAVHCFKCELYVVTAPGRADIAGGSPASLV